MVSSIASLPTEATPEEEKRALEDKLLKVGYFGMLLDRHPFNQDPNSCFNEEGAILLHLEQEYLRIPEGLAYQDLAAHIVPEAKERLKKIWDALVKAEKKLRRASESLLRKWQKAPTIEDAEKLATTDSLIDATPIKVDAYRNAFRAHIVNITDDDDSEESSIWETDISDWREDEKGRREGIYKKQKAYRVLLRQYFEGLLENEKDEKGNSTKFALPMSHPSRDEIAERNRYVRFLDAIHQAIAVAKAAHHTQPKGRLRKGEKKPYILHTLDVTTAMLMDDLSFEISERRLRIDPAIMAILGMIHDLVEDTDLTLEELIRNYLSGSNNNRIDFYDSSIDTILGPVLPTDTKDRDQYKKRVLNLVKNDFATIIRQVLRIVSNNTKLENTQKGENEKLTAFKQNIAGTAKTLIALREMGTSDDEMKSWGIKPEIKEPNARTFRQFTEEEDGGKMTKFLIKLNAITQSPNKQRAALIVKIEDRANNIDSLDGLPIEMQLKNVRSATNRLIAWTMVDHNHATSPLYYAPLRLIEATLRRYQKIQEEQPEALIARDHQYIEQLKVWRSEAKVLAERHVFNDRIMNVMKEWRAANPSKPVAYPLPEKQSSPQPEHLPQPEHTDEPFQD